MGIPDHLTYLLRNLYLVDWWATVHGVTKSWTQLTDFTSLTHRRSVPASPQTQEQG